MDEKLFISKEKVESKSKITTIKLTEQTKSRVNHLRLYERETYEDIIKRMLEILNLSRLEPEKARHKLLLLDKERRENLSNKSKN